MIEVRETLLAYSCGLLSRQDAIQRLGVRYSADLLVALGDAGLPMPLPSTEELERQAEIIVRLWRMG